jgi:hypothetical protein
LFTYTKTLQLPKAAPAPRNSGIVIDPELMPEKKKSGCC